MLLCIHDGTPNPKKYFLEMWRFVVDKDDKINSSSYCFPVYNNLEDVLNTNFERVVNNIRFGRDATYF